MYGYVIMSSDNLFPFVSGNGLCKRSMDYNQGCQKVGGGRYSTKKKSTTTKKKSKGDDCGCSKTVTGGKKKKTKMVSCRKGGEVHKHRSEKAKRECKKKNKNK